jgi:hypothetical protein
MTKTIGKLTELGIAPLGGDAFVPLSAAEVASIEKAIGADLPRDYKQFLTRFGRSMFNAEVNCTPFAKPLYFGWFFGYAELLEAFDNLRDLLPETVIAIGDDGGGNAFCLGVRPPDTGKVYFHNHGYGWHADAERLAARGEPIPGDIRYQTVHPIAVSFAEFVENMKKVGELS